MIMRLLSTYTALCYCGIYMNTGIPMADASSWIKVFTRLQKTIQ